MDEKKLKALTDCTCEEFRSLAFEASAESESAIWGQLVGDILHFAVTTGFVE